MSTSNVTLINIDGYSQENGVIFFQTNKKLQENIEDCFVQDEEGGTIVIYYSDDCIYNYCNKFMISWWGQEKYLNNEQIKISDIEMLNVVLVSSVSFGYSIRSNQLVITHIQLG